MDRHRCEWFESLFILNTSLIKTNRRSSDRCRCIHLHETSDANIDSKSDPIEKEFFVKNVFFASRGRSWWAHSESIILNADLSISWRYCRIKLSCVFNLVGMKHRKCSHCRLRQTKPASILREVRLVFPPRTEPTFRGFSWSEMKIMNNDRICRRLVAHR